jgi:predicted ArsR family transcriptional regulator
METTVLVLHGLVVKKAGSAEQIAAVLGLDEDEARSALEEALAAGEVAGARGTYMPTSAGRTRLDAAYPQAYGQVRADVGM